MDPSADPRPAGPPRRRRAVVAGLLMLAGALAVAVAWVERLRQHQALRAAAIAAFDLDAAMNLAGAVVPEDIESFYFFVLEPEAPDEAGELAAKLVQAAGEHEFLGITGADSDHNRAVLRAALASVQTRNLDGLVLIYVGPPEHEAELVPLVRASGAQLRFVIYLPGGGDTI